MKADKPKTAIVHYTAPPVIGGVEGVIEYSINRYGDRKAGEAGWRHAGNSK